MSEGSWFDSRQRQAISSPQCPSRLWGPSSLLFNGYQGIFSWGQCGQTVKLTTHLRPVTRLITATVPHLFPYAFIQWKKLHLFACVTGGSYFDCSMYSGIPYSNLETCIHYPNSGYSQFVLHPSQLTAHITALLHFSQHTRHSSTSWLYPRSHKILQNKKACQYAQCLSGQ
jgi:hypothetical protein